MNGYQQCHTQASDANIASGVGRPGGDGVASTPLFIPKILLVDDEPHVVDGLSRALREHPYEIQTATSADRALQKFARDRFDVIVADERMPGMQGSQLLALIAKEFPMTARILLTGHATPEAAARAVNEAGVVRFLIKPCPVQAVQEAIEAALRATPFDKRIRKGCRPYLVSCGMGARGEKHTYQRTDATSSGRSSATVSEAAQPARLNLEAHELVLQAQKVVELDTETLFGFELSMQLHTRHGHGPTVDHFPGSDLGQQVPLSTVDRWVVRQVLDSVRRHEQTLNRRNVIVSVNIATQSLADADFARFLDRELSDARLASRFVIEVRESALSKSLPKDKGLLVQLAGLKCYDRGARLCIDGVSGSIWKQAVLKSLPVGVAKLDSRFAGDLLTNPESERVVREAVDWGRRTGITLVATGVDTPAIAARLRTLGVRFGQGIAFGGMETLRSGLGSLFT